MAAIAGVRVSRGVLPGGLGVGAAGVADEDGPLLHIVAGASVAGAPVDGVLVVEAAAGRVELD